MIRVMHSGGRPRGSRIEILTGGPLTERLLEQLVDALLDGLAAACVIACRPEQLMPRAVIGNYSSGYSIT